jgi:hypothetical protein
LASSNSFWVSSAAEMTSAPAVAGTLAPIHLSKKSVPRVLIGKLGSTYRPKGCLDSVMSSASSVTPAI